MFEGVILIIFFIIGGLTALLALFFFVIALLRKSKRMFKAGLAIAIVPLSLYALTYWFYDIHIPRLNKQEEKAYAGTYVMVSSSNSGDLSINYEEQPQLVLNTDNTFRLDKNNFSSFYGEGTWKAGATDDGQFEFRDKNNSVVFLGTPSNNNKLEINKNFNYAGQIVFVKQAVLKTTKQFYSK